MKLHFAGLCAGLLVSACGESEDIEDLAHRALVSDDAAVSAPVFDMPYLMSELDNGLRVIIVETDYPDIVDMQISVQAGSRNEVEEGKSGFAHFFEHMMFRGTEKYSSELYSDTLKKAGAATNAFTTDDFTNFYLTFTKPDLEKLIEVEADRFQNLKYTESDFRTEALAIKGEYLKNFSNPTNQAFERTRALAFNVHPYSHTTMGFIEDIEAMPEQFDYATMFFDRWYRPQNVTLVIVGDVDAKRTLSLVRKYWGAWERGSFVADIPAEPAPAGPQYEHLQWDGETQPWLFFGFRSPAFVATQKDMPAMSVISSIYFSDSSDLYEQLVIDDQYADLLLTDFPMNRDPNLNLIYVRLTDEAHAAAVTDAVLATLAEARTQLIDAEKLQQTKSRLRYRFTANLGSAGDIGSMLAQFVPFERTPETVNQMYRTFDVLDANDVRDIADQYFRDDSRVLVSLSRSASLRGMDDIASVDALAAVRKRDAIPQETANSAEPKEDERFDASGEAVPVSVIAQPSVSSPLVDVAVLVHAGAAMDPPGKKGLAALTAAMLTDGGSARWSIQEINAAMYPIASGFESHIDKEMTRLAGQVHKDNLETWYRYARSQLLNPGWHRQDFERVTTQLENSLRTGLIANNDEELGKELLYSRIYAEGHPYGAPNLGKSQDIASLTLDDVKDFYRDHYTINNITVGIAGGYPEGFVAQLSKDMQVLPAGERDRIDVARAPEISRNAATIVQKETPAVAVSFGFPIDLTRGDSDWVALWLARSYLGEHRSENSHLYQRIRELRGMNYGDYAYIEYFPDGMYRSSPDTNLGRQQQIFQIWLRPLRNNNDALFATRTAVFELHKLVREGMSEADFEATRSFLSKFVSLMTDGQTRQLGYALDNQYYETGEFARYVRDGLASLTLADVNRVIRENLGAENMQFVFVTRNAEDLQQRLASDQPSPISYDAEKPDELLAEDRAIEALPLDIEAEDIAIIPAERVFQ